MTKKRHPLSEEVLAYIKDPVLLQRAKNLEVSSNERVKLWCEKHGEFEKSWGGFVKSSTGNLRHGCPKCGRMVRSDHQIPVGSYGNVYCILVDYAGKFCKVMQEDLEKRYRIEDSMDLVRLSRNLGIAEIEEGIRVKDLCDLLGFRFEYSGNKLVRFWCPVFLDKEDYEKYRTCKLSLNINDGDQFLLNRIYVHRKEHGRCYHIHVEIINRRAGFETDHLDRFPFDNVRDNLLEVTKRQNIDKSAKYMKKEKYLLGVKDRGDSLYTHLPFIREGIELHSNISLDYGSELVLAKIFEWFKIYCRKTPNYRRLFDEIDIDSIVDSLSNANLVNFLTAVWGIDKEVYSRFSDKQVRNPLIRRSGCYYRIPFSCKSIKGGKIEKGLFFEEYNDAWLAWDFVMFRILKRPVGCPPGLEPISTIEEFMKVIDCKDNFERLVFWIKEVDKDSKKYKGCWKRFEEMLKDYL